MYNIHLKTIVKNNKTYTYYTLNYKLANNKYLPLTSNSKEGLIQKVEKLEGKGVNYNLRLDSPTTLKDLFNDYLDKYIKDNRSIHTYISYKSVIDNHILPYFEKMSYQDINSYKIQQFYNHLINDKRLSPSSSNKIYFVLKETFEYAVSCGIFYRNPCDKTIKRKSNGHHLSSPIKPESLKIMWQYLMNTKYANIYGIMLYTSLRRGEALGISINDINLKENTIYIHQQVISYRLNKEKFVCIEQHTKTHLSRIISISDDCKKFILAELDKQHKNTITNPNYTNKYNLLFTNENGELIDPASVSLVLKNIAKKISCPKARLHDLRHTAASIMYEATGNIYAVQQALGHESPRTTEQYVFPSKKLQEEAAITVAATINKQIRIKK